MPTQPDSAMLHLLVVRSPLANRQLVDQDGLLVKLLEATRNRVVLVVLPCLREDLTCERRSSRKILLAVSQIITRRVCMLARG